MADKEVRMADKRDQMSGPDAPEPGVKRTTSDASFDRWLAGQMRKLYDEVLEESVPDDLVQLVRSFDPEDDEANDSDDAGAKSDGEQRKSGDQRRTGNSQRRG